ncbi:hypothetical protein Tco_0538320 [Tanacetum coccineum]
MLQICPKLPNHQFKELPFEEAILIFLRDLSHSGKIEMITDVNVNKFYQPWRSFAAVINKCLGGKSIGYDSLRLSQAQILWGMYHKKNVDYAYLLWEYFIYQVENNNVKKSNEMYYPRFTKVIVNFFMTKVVYRHEDTQLYGAILPNELTNEDIRNSKSYKEYYAIASGAKPPKTKASVKKKQVGSDKTNNPPTNKGKRLKTSAKAAKPSKKKQPAKTSKAKGLTMLSEVALRKGADEGTRSIPGVPYVPTYGSDDEQISWKSSNEEDDDEVALNDDDDDNDDHNDDADNLDDDGQEYDEHDDEEQGDDDEQTDSDNDGDDFIHLKFSTHGEEDKEEDSFDPRVQTPSHVESTNDEDIDEEIQDANVKGDKMNEKEYILYEANELYRNVNVNLEGRDTEMTDALRTIVQTTQVIEDTHVIITLVNPEGQQQSSSVSSGFVSNMLNPSPDTVVSLIPGIVDAYLANKMHEAVKTVVQLQSKRLRDEAQAKNADFLNKLDDNIKKIINGQVKEQVKAQVSKILPKIKKTVNEQLEDEVLTRSSNESKTSHDVATNLSELELKKILIDMMESNKRRDDKDKDEEPSAGSNQGSKRRRAGKEPESTSAPKEKTSKTSGKSYKGSKSQNKATGESAQTEEPMHTTKYLEEPAHQEFETGVTEDQPNEETLYSLAQKEDPRESFNELMDTPLDFSAFMMNMLKVDTLTPELLTSQQYPHDLRKPLPLIPNSRGRHVISFDHFINNDLEYLSGGVSSQKYATLVTKTKATDYGHIKWIENLVPNRMWSQVPVSYEKHALCKISHWGRKRQQFYGFAANRESAQDVYSKRKIIAVTKLEIVDWHNYKHLDWITVRRDNDKLYKFKEGDFNRLRIQDIKDMLLLLVQGKLTNLTVKEPLAFNVSLRMFTRSVVIQRRVEDLQLGNKDKKNRLMRIDELHKFSDGTLNDVWTALNGRLKGIQMEYMPQTIWRQSDEDKAGAMIQAIDKQLKTRRIMRSLEKFVGGRPYEGNFRLLQRTI